MAHGMASDTRPPFRALDRLGWPVETIRGRPILNAIRLLLHTRRIARWSPPVFKPDPSLVGHVAVQPATAEEAQHGE